VPQDVEELPENFKEANANLPEAVDEPQNAAPTVEEAVADSAEAVGEEDGRNEFDLQHSCALLSRDHNHP
jgi:hypothetical protein